MPRTYPPLFPGAARQLAALGERLRLARLRRRISAIVLAQRVGISRDTLRRIESGHPNIAIGTYVRVLRALMLEQDIDAIARDDRLGRKLQDLGLEPPHRQLRTPP